MQRLFVLNLVTNCNCTCMSVRIYEFRWYSVDDVMIDNFDTVLTIISVIIF